VDSNWHDLPAPVRAIAVALDTAVTAAQTATAAAARTATAAAAWTAAEGTAEAAGGADDAGYGDAGYGDAGYGDAVERLAALDGERVGLVAGETVRLLLEDRHPDGLDGDDLRAALSGCVRSTAGWYPAVDATVLGALLAGALGVHDSDGQPIVVPPGAAASHAPLLIAELTRGAPHPLAVYLRGALGGIETRQVNDLP
jgi:hypothetical protein